MLTAVICLPTPSQHHNHGIVIAALTVNILPMKIQTGRGFIPLTTLLAIWSISLVVNLPGLAITPILGNIEQVFPTASQLEVQLLTILPNLFIIPFVLLAGKLSVSKSKIKIVITALSIYTISGVLYLFAETMPQLIIISCLLGVGCGLLIPLAAGLVADFFVGKYRMQQLGIKSGIANMSLVLATFAVGWLADKGWHLPFLVYLLPIIPLALTPFLWGDRGKPSKPTTAAGKKRARSSTAAGSLDKPKMWALAGFYGFLTYAVIVISYYMPFLAHQYNISDTTLGTIISLFFLSIMLPGFVLPWVIRIVQPRTTLVMMSMMAVGLALILFADRAWMFGLAVVMMGVSYGTFQPLIYEKATEAATGKKTTLALSIVLIMNYIAVTVAPFIIDQLRALFGTHSDKFPFLVNLIMVLIVTVLSYFYRQSFVFKSSDDY